NYYLWVVFEDKFETKINIKPFISTGFSSKLSEINYFKSVKIDESGGIGWENGFDFCPNFLRKIAEK
ncbi:MAG: DUF2442 domain-containing protein, partial [Sediminibacterium sp.]|nr:DUF2442 domain-containing protein [Sediminibacterium sp.]